MKLSNRVKLGFFIGCMVVGLFLQLSLAARCRCAWGDWESRFIDGAVVLDIVAGLHIGYAIIKRTFYQDCVRLGVVVLSSVVWVPLVYKITVALYSLATEGRIGQMGH